MNKFWNSFVLCGLFFNNVDGMANCKEIPKFWLLLLYHFKLTWFSVHQLFSLDIFFLQIDNIHFFCLVQKSVTVCFQSTILLVSKRLLIILLSHSKLFIGHCTYPLFLGTFSFAVSCRIYQFVCQMDFNRLLSNYDILSLTLFYISCYYINTVLKKGCQKSRVSKHRQGKKCSQNTLWSYYRKIIALFTLEASKSHWWV